MFIARERELAQLEQAYASGSFHMIPVYGRRRVGKTALLTHFVANKANARYFTATQTSAQENLHWLSAAILGESGPSASASSLFGQADMTFSSYEAAFTSLFEQAQTTRMVFVIDEYPYLAESAPEVSSILQALIDRYRSTSQLMLILCGSSMSFMEHQVLGEKSPLYGRRTAQLRVDPFDVFDAARLLRSPDPVTTVELYAIAGGIPLYLEQFDAEQGTRWNLEHRVLAPGCVLSIESESFLMQEFRNPRSYNAVLSAIGPTRASQKTIVDRTGPITKNISPILARLEELGVVRRLTPLPHGKRNQTRYEISDILIRFSSTFFTRYATAIASGMGGRVADRIMGSEFPTFVGPVFEEVCRQWLLRQMASDAIDAIPQTLGTWWGTNPETKCEEELDIVAATDGPLLLGECKWRNQPVDSDALETLQRRGRLVSGSQDTSLFIFAKTGFTPGLRSKAENVARLVSLEEML